VKVADLSEQQLLRHNPATMMLLFILAVSLPFVVLVYMVYLLIVGRKGKK
jgi:hypothetical protein